MASASLFRKKREDRTNALRIFMALATRLGMLFGGTAAIATARVRSTTAMFTAFLAALGHMLAILADGLAALAAGFPRFFRGELVSMSAFMRSTSAFAGDFALFGVVHAGKAASAILTLFVFSICHDLALQKKVEMRHACVPHRHTGEA